MQEDNSQVPFLTDPEPSADLSENKTAPSATPSLPPKKSNLILPLLVYSLVATGGLVYLYIQSQTLSQQVQVLQSTLQTRTIEPTPTPTSTNLNLLDSPQSTESTSINQLDAGDNAFDLIPQIKSIAQQTSDKAQLLMITSDNLAVDNPSYKFWFRYEPATKKYFYLEASTTTQPKLIAAASVSPDNNITDLLPLFESSTKFTNDQQALVLVKQELVDQTITGVSAKFIIVNDIPLWELVIDTPSRSGLVMQVDTTSGTITYSNY